MAPLPLSDGNRLVPMLRGTASEPGPREVLAEFHGHHFPCPQRMLRTDNCKLIINAAGVVAPGACTFGQGSRATLGLDSGR